jgi:argininosuccinate lyase
MLAKTAASGGETLHPEVLAFGSSLSEDLRLYRADALGSAAHATMLGEVGLLAPEVARTLRRALCGMAHTLPTLPPEEDVHMAIEAALGQAESREVREAAPHLHTGRSRNDQVATALRLFARDMSAKTEAALLDVVEMLLARAEREGHHAMPMYTHRQLAQPANFGYWLRGHAEMLLRDVETFAAARTRANLSPLGSGAIAGSTLPLDRTRTAALLGFDGVTAHAADTVGDRDFALEFAFAAAKTGVHLGRLGQDVVDFSTAEFGFFVLGGAIASGSSMMPQKRNPDVFELIRGRGAAPTGDLMQLLMLTKALPLGYSRDLQEDRRPLYSAFDTTLRSAKMLNIALPEVRLAPAEMARGLEGGGTQATDLAEALVRRGVPFRVAYKRVGALVAYATAHGTALARLTEVEAREVDPCFDGDVLRSLSPTGAAERKATPGSPGSGPAADHTAALRARVDLARAALNRVLTLDKLFETLSAMP